MVQGFYMSNGLMLVIVSQRNEKAYLHHFNDTYIFSRIEDTVKNFKSSAPLNFLLSLSSYELIFGGSNGPFLFLFLFYISELYFLFFSCSFSIFPFILTILPGASYRGSFFLFPDFPVCHFYKCLSL